MLIGGLPDAVNTFIETSNIVSVRAVHDEIYDLYKEDASKYDNENSLKIKRIYEMIPSNMENKKKRLYYNEIENKKGKRNSDYEAELEYLKGNIHEYAEAIKLYDLPQPHITQ